MAKPQAISRQCRFAHLFAPANLRPLLAPGLLPATRCRHLKRPIRRELLQRQSLFHVCSHPCFPLTFCQGFANFEGDAGALLRTQRLKTVDRIANIARDQRVDAVLVAGDVFETNAVADDTLRRTLNQMQSFNGPWVLLPGNHDAALADSVWTRLTRIGLPGNVTQMICAFCELLRYFLPCNVVPPNSGTENASQVGRRRGG